MKKPFLIACLLGFLAPASLFASPFGIDKKSISASQQFIVYCDDAAMRLAVSGFAEDTKSAMLNFLGQQDAWKIPVVISLRKADSTAPDQPNSQVQLYEVEGGTRKVEIDIVLGGDLAAARFQYQLVKAILFEMEYRGKPVGKDIPYVEPPRWLVEGFSVYLQNRGADTDVDVYRILLEKNHLPPIADFLSQDPSDLNAASLKLYQAYSTSLLRLVKGLPNGRACLASYIKDLPLGKDAPTADLMKHFPPLGGSRESLEKWWTLSMANISASDRYSGLSLEDTEERLVALLKIAVPINKKGETKVFTIEEFKDFVKLPAARPALADAAINLQALTSRSNPLYRPIVAEYQTVIGELQRGKVKKTEKRLKAMAQYRELVLHRMDQIADYMNWFEATKMVLRSNSFDDYMKTANQLSSDASKRDDGISRYLDSIELQMQ